MSSSRRRALESSGPDPKNPLGVEIGDTVTYRRGRNVAEVETTFMVSSVGGGSDTVYLKAFNSQKRKEEFKCDARFVIRVEAKGAGAAAAEARTDQADPAAIADVAAPATAAEAAAAAVTAGAAATAATAAVVNTKAKAQAGRRPKKPDSDDDEYSDEDNGGDRRRAETHNTSTRTDVPAAGDGVRPPLMAANVSISQGNEDVRANSSSLVAVSSGGVVDTNSADGTPAIDAIAAEPAHVAKSTQHVNVAVIAKKPTYLAMKTEPSVGDKVWSRFRGQRKGRLYAARVESVQDGKVVLAYFKKGTEELAGDNDTVTLKYVWPWTNSAGVVAGDDDVKNSYAGVDLDDGGIPVLFVLDATVPLNVDHWTVFTDNQPSCMMGEVSTMASSTVSTRAVFNSSTPPSSSLPRIPLETRQVKINGEDFMATMESDGSKRYFTVLDIQDYLDAWAEGRIADFVPTVSAAASANKAPIFVQFPGLFELASTANVAAAMDGNEPRSVVIKVGGSEQTLMLALGGRNGVNSTRPTQKSPFYYVTTKTVESHPLFGINVVDALSVQKGEASASRATAFSMCLANFKEAVDSEPVEVIVIAFLYMLVSGNKDFVQVLYVLADSETNTPARALASAASINSVAAIFEHFEFRPQDVLPRPIGDLKELRDLYFDKLKFDPSFGLSRQTAPFVSNASDGAVVDFASLMKPNADMAKVVSQSEDLMFWTKKKTSDGRQQGNTVRASSPSLSQQKAAAAVVPVPSTSTRSGSRKGPKGGSTSAEIGKNLRPHIVPVFLLRFLTLSLTLLRDLSLNNSYVKTLLSPQPRRLLSVPVS